MKYLIPVLALMAPQMVMAQAWRGYEEDEYYDSHGGDDSSLEFWFYPPAVIATIIIYLILIARWRKEDAGKNKETWSWGASLFAFPFLYFVIYLPVILVGAVLKKIFL